MAANQHPRTAGAALAISVLAGVGLLAGCTGGGSGAAAPSASAVARSAGGTDTPTAAASGPGVLTPPALLDAAKAALRSGGSVHVDFTDTLASGLIHFSDDATPSGGRQVITVNNEGRITILLIGGVGYIQADDTALEGFFGVPWLQAEHVAGQWIKLQAGEKIGQSSYDDVTAGITLSSVASELTLSGAPEPARRSTIDGQPVAGVEAPMPASAQLPASARNVLYVQDNALHRPVVLEVLDAGSYKYQMSFSQWGEAVHLTAPAYSIPASAVMPATSIA